MSTKTIAKLMSSDAKFAAQFMVQPKETLTEFGLDGDGMEEEDVRAMETVVRLSQDTLRANAKLIGVEIATAAWGIGAGCCSSKSISIRNLAPRR